MQGQYLKLHQRLLAEFENEDIQGLVNSGTWKKLLQAQAQVLLESQAHDASKNNLQVPFVSEDDSFSIDCHIPVGYKQCNGQCGRILQANASNFRKDKRNKDGLRGRCKTCMSNKSRKKKRTLDEANVRLQEYTIARICEEEATQSHVERLLADSNILAIVVKMENRANINTRRRSQRVSEWSLLANQIEREGHGKMCQVVIQSTSLESPPLPNTTLNDDGTGLSIELDQFSQTIRENPDLQWYLSNFSLEEEAITSAQKCQSRLNTILGLSDISRNLLLYLHPQHNVVDGGYTDNRDCRYINLYYYLGGKNTFAALHRDTLGMPAGNVVLEGCKQWTFFGGSTNILEKAFGGAHRLGRELSVPDTEWLSQQYPELSVVNVDIGPGELVIVNCQTPHTVTNIGTPSAETLVVELKKRRLDSGCTSTITSSVACNILPPACLSDAWKQMHHNRQLGVSSKVLLQELVWRAMRNGVQVAKLCFQDLCEAQLCVFESKFPRRIHHEQVDDFYWCDLCKGEIWNARIECHSCKELWMCCFCFKEMRHSPHHDMTLHYYIGLDQLSSRLG